MRRTRTLATLGLLVVVGAMAGVAFGAGAERAEPPRSVAEDHPVVVETVAPERARPAPQAPTPHGSAQPGPAQVRGAASGELEDDRLGSELDPLRPGTVERGPIRSESEPPVLVAHALAAPMPLGETPGAPIRDRAPLRSVLGAGRLDAGTPDAGGETTLIMYATTWCHVCTRARRWMNANEIAFVERDVEADPEAAQRHAELNPRRSVPTFERAERTLIGFSPAALRELLEDEP